MCQPSVHAATKLLFLKLHKFNIVPYTLGGRLLWGYIFNKLYKACTQAQSILHCLTLHMRHRFFKQTSIFWNKGTSSTPEMQIHDIKVRLCYITSAATVTEPVLFSDTVHLERYTGHILRGAFNNLSTWVRKKQLITKNNFLFFNVVP
jgi:hypothetical protein